MTELDNPIWDSLCTHHAALARGGRLARRFPRDVSPFAATVDDAPASLAALAAVGAPVGELMLLQRRPIAVPEGWTADQTGEGVQLVAAETSFSAPPGFEPRILDEQDVPEMLELTGLTKPGPFRQHTNQLSTFFGVRIDGRLAAMAGERLRHERYSEVSGVCTHPDFRGLGLARKLSAFIAARIAARGQAPYLHAYASNAAAIGLYESLGFRQRCRVNVAVLVPA